MNTFYQHDSAQQLANHLGQQAGGLSGTQPNQLYPLSNLLSSPLARFLLRIRARDKAREKLQANLFVKDL